MLFVADVDIIDYLTGPDYSLSILYLGPVIVAAWFRGRSAGVVISLVAALAWLLTELVGKNTVSMP